MPSTASRLAVLLACVVAPPVTADERHRRATASSAPAACFGDCGGDGAVTVDELVRLVSVALGALPADSCAPQVPAIDDLVRAVGHALDGCPGIAPTPTPTLVEVDDGLLLPDRILRLEFTTHPPFVESLPDTLYALLGEVERQAPYTTIRGALYDGDVLLGVSTSTTGCCATGTYSFNPVPVTWRSPDSAWDFPAGDPATVDFTALRDGAIDGRIDITIDAGRIALEPDAAALVFIDATYANGGSTIPPAPRLRSARLLGGVTPRPTATAAPSAAATPTATASPATTVTATASRSPDDDD